MTDSIQESHLVLLHLSPIKNSLRDLEWARCKDKVLATAHRVIGETLSPDDAYTIHGDETCMIAFAKTDVARATSIACEISENIVRSQFGEIGMSRFPLQPRVLAIRDILHSVDPLDAGGVLNGILNTPQAANLTGTSTAPPKDQHRDAMKAARRSKLFELFEPERAAEIRYEYHPIWCADNQLVERFKYVPYLKKSPMERLIGYNVLGPNRTEADIVDLDIESVENSLIDLKQAADAGHEIKLSLPVHFETIGSNHGRSELMKILPVLPTSFRGRLSFWIDGIPEGIPEGRLQEVAGVLKPFSESQSVMFDARQENVKLLKNMLAKVRSVGMDAVCFRLPPNASHANFKDCCAIVPLAASFGLRVAATGLTSGGEVFELTSAGCLLLSGPLFGGPFEALPEPYSMSIGAFEQPGKASHLPRFVFG